VKEFLLDFGVHQDFIRHVGDEPIQVDTLLKPILTEYIMDLS